MLQSDQEIMLIIGHRGAAGSAPENTLEALRHGHSVGADMLEFDVQITRDDIPIVIHDSTLLRTHGRRHWVRFTSHESIRKATEKGHQIATLEEVMDEFFGKVLLNLELKNRGTAKAVIRLVERYVTQPEDWQNILFSSFKPGELLRIRQLCPQAELAMLHHRNPFLFIAYQRKLRFSAVGFEHDAIDGQLIERIDAFEGRENQLGDIVDRFGNAFAEVTFGVAVAEFDGFMFTGAGTGRNRRAAHGATSENDIYFHGGVAAGVQNFTCININDRAHIQNQ